MAVGIVRTGRVEGVGTAAYQELLGIHRIVEVDTCLLVEGIDPLVEGIDPMVEITLAVGTSQGVVENLRATSFQRLQLSLHLGFIKCYQRFLLA